MNKKFVLGLDVGISSVGWGIVLIDDDNNPYKILDTGVKIFNAAEVPKTGASKAADRRSFRGIRRILRRRGHRVDRIKRLLNVHGLLGDKVLCGQASEIYCQLDPIFINMLDMYYKKKNINPYDLKVEALDRKLTKEELCIILVHYAKHRGYKSNRNEDSKDSELGKVQKSLDENTELMKEKKYRTISEMFQKDEKFISKKRNASGDYKSCVKREQYLEEIEKVLDSQIMYGLITEEFKLDYIKIWSSQRHYAKGPGGSSKYGGDLIARMVGTCNFDGNPRAPKCAPSAEIFVALTTLLNLEYKEHREENYQSLNANQIEKIIELSKKQNKVTIAAAFKELGLDEVYIKGWFANPKECDAAKKEFEKKFNKAFQYEQLSEEELKKYDSLRLNAMNKRTLIELKSYSIMRKQFTIMGTEIWDSLKNDFNTLDKIAEILTNYKTEEDIEQHVIESGIDNIYMDIIKDLPNFKDHNKLSLELIRKLNPILMQGIKYSDAMKQVGYNHSNPINNLDKKDLLIPMNEDNEINNQRVIRSLAQTRGIINSIIKKYGMPEIINVETARELSKSYKERKEIEKRQEDNYLKNTSMKEHLVENGIFESIDKISNTDLLKYKLWLEQQEKCAYSLETIPLDKLFSPNFVQIDHILPYSRTFNDTYFNKTLVLSKYNQDKRNKTPYEWFGKTEKWNDYEKYINSLDISDAKKENYLLKKLTLEMESDYRNQNLNDTKYITKYLVSYIKANLNVNKVGCPSGSITAKLRSYWHLNNLTHSINSKNYYVNEKNIDKKNRENHLHHAMDALIIAVTTPKLIKRISDFERYRRYIDNQPLSTLISYISDKDAEFDINQFVDENGEVLESNLKEYAKEVRDREYFRVRKNNTIQLLAPLPYSNFDEEAKIRVYERSKEQMDFLLKGMGYSDLELKDVTPIIPKFAREKIAGGLHKETYYGLRTDLQGNQFKTSRIDIANKNFNANVLENIVEKNGGSKDIYETVKKWLGDKNGEEAFKNHDGYPLKPKTKDNSYIKKITIQEIYEGKGHVLYGNKIVETNKILQVNIYQKEKDDKLYFVGFDRLDIENIKKGIDFDVLIWSGQGKYEVVSINQISNQYKKYLQLRKNEYIKITLNNGNVGYGYVVGCSSGMFEIKSALGDFGELVEDEKSLFNSYRKQYQLTVSSIASIEKIKLNNLGKIE